MSSSMDIHSSYTFFCIPSGDSRTITDGHVPARQMDDLRRKVMKDKPRNSWDVWGKVTPDVSSQVEREVLRTSIVNAGLMKMRDRSTLYFKTDNIKKKVVITQNE
ncbi:hypothetical protein AVEN_148294-1 [Araneus ventricosus]|uniref:Uncharacterized protein n=1 Tax=Araneus ventricosus TaxID=182803 RepID=A0A4Y2FTE4_ARAVE|nr:hypothetical protein AVEN_148294-1 [Araneus ventricosus]